MVTLLRSTTVGILVREALVVMSLLRPLLSDVVVHASAAFARARPGLDDGDPRLDRVVGDRTEGATTGRDN
jgi:hypothetical protein